MDSFVKVLMEASKKGESCNELKIAIPVVWYKEGNEIHIGIMGCKDMYIVEIGGDVVLDDELEDLVKRLARQYITSKMK